MKALELSFNLIVLLIMGLLVAMLVATSFTGQSSQIFKKLSGFGKSAVSYDTTIGIAGDVCKVTTGTCKFTVEEYTSIKNADAACKHVKCETVDGEPADGCCTKHEDKGYVEWRAKP